jgi:hypothetical protein
MCQKRQLMGALHSLLTQHLALLEVQEGQAARRQAHDLPGDVATIIAAPQGVDDAGYMAACTNDPAHTEVEANAPRRQAAHLVKEVQR